MEEYSNKRCLRRILEAKKKARSELSAPQWYSLNYAKEMTLIAGTSRNNVEKIDGSDVTAEQFQALYESRNIPLILTGIVKQWPAYSAWTLDSLAKKYRNQRFKCGEDDEGYPVKLKMKYYMEYMRHNNDDCPLYIFDSNFADHKKTRDLVSDYSVPTMFANDLFDYADDSRRPPYRWFVIGPPRSGTGIHTDPLGTSAWNALISGHKKWCMFPPWTPKTLVKPRPDEEGIHPDEAIQWFLTVYQRAISSSWPDEYRMFETTQKPGEIMFVPCGWRHVVINLDDTIAITQNLCTLTNLPIVWRNTVKSRPKLAKHWLRRLREHCPKAIATIESTYPYASLLQSYLNDPSSSSSSSESTAESTSDEEYEISTFPQASSKRMLTAYL